MDLRDWIAYIVGLSGAIIGTGYLEQNNYIPQENFFVSMVAILILWIGIGTAINLITGNTEDKEYFNNLQKKIKENKNE
jgi:uncharacterized membrane protein (DUF106 family)